MTIVINKIDLNNNFNTNLNQYINNIMSFNPQTYLEKINPHPKDKNVTFYDPTHTYTIQLQDSNGNNFKDDTFTSVTTWNHSHFGRFDADAIIEKMMKSPKWKNSKYYGMTPEQIKELWDKNRDEAAKAGTIMHYDIECYYNKVPVKNDSIEFKWFLDFEHERTKENGFAPHLKPFRTEMIVYDEELRLVGSVDMIFEAPDGTLQIYDWKRCREIKKTNSWQYSHVECISHLPDTNYWHYTLQLNTYRAIIERNYNRKVTDLYLVCLHPENKNNSFQRIKVPILKQEIDDLFALRLKQLKQK